MSTTGTVKKLSDCQGVHNRTLYGKRGYPEDLEPDVGLEDRVAHLEASLPPPLDDRARIPLDAFPGTTDDDKLDGFETHAKAQDFPPILSLPNRLLIFKRKRQVWDNLRVDAPESWSNPQLGERGMTHGIKLEGMSGETGWWHLPAGASHGVTFRNLSFVTASGARFLTCAPGAHFYTLQLHALSCNGLRSLLGSRQNKLAITGAFFTGPWQMANCYEIIAHLAGSDSRLWMDGALVDTHPNYATSQGFSGRPQLWFDWLDKSVAGPLFVTAEGPWEGIHIDGPPIGGGRGNPNAGELVLLGLRVEGRNPGQPCDTSPIRVRGGTVRFVGLGAGWSEQHLIDHTGGRLFIDGLNVGRLDRENTTPVGISSGNAEVRVRDMVEAMRTARPANVEVPVPPRWELLSGARLYVDPLEMVSVN